MHRQRGAAILLMLLVVVMGGLYFAFSGFSPQSFDYQRAQKTNQALAAAKEALLSYALLKTDFRPGALPCPDTHDETHERYGVAALLSGLQCPDYVGRLPWETLRMDTEPEDGNGMRLWYALSANFRDDESAEPINSNTPGDLTISVRGDGNAAIAGNDCLLEIATIPDVAAVVFAPGKALASLSQASYRDGTADVRGYLEGENADGDTVFAFCQQSNSDFTSATLDFNDQVLFLSRAELMEAVERRVMGEVKRALNEHYRDNGQYPWLVPFEDPTTSYFQPLPNTVLGWVPYHAVDQAFYTGFSATWSFSGVRYDIPSSLPGNTVVQADLESGGPISVGCGGGQCGECVWSDATTVSCTGTYTENNGGVLPAGVDHRDYAFDWRFTGNEQTTQGSATTIATRKVELGTSGSPASLPYLATGAVIDIRDYDSGGGLVGQGAVYWDTVNPSGHIAMDALRYNPVFPAWYVKNQWHQLTMAVIAPDFSPVGSQSCAGNCLHTLWLEKQGTSGTVVSKPYQQALPALALAAGPEINSPDLTQNRAASPNLEDFLEELNQDADYTEFATARDIPDFNDQLLPFSPN